MLRILTSRSRTLCSSPLRELVSKQGLVALSGGSSLQARAIHQAAAGCHRQSLSSSSSSSSSHLQWPQQCWRSNQYGLQQQCLQPAGAAGALRDSRRASFSTSSPSAQKQQHNQQQKQNQPEQDQKQQQQARHAQSRILQMEYKSATLAANLSEHTTFPLPLRQAGVLPHPIKTAKHVWQFLRNKYFIMVALAKARSNIPGFSALGDTELQQQFASMYVRIQEAQASFAIDRIKDLVSRDVFFKLQSQAQRRREGRWDKIVWSVENEEELHDPRTKSLKLVEGRWIKLSNDSPFDWIRLTYRIRSKQRFAVYKVEKGQRELVAGNPDEVIDVEDYWMFEHKTRTAVKGEKLPVEGACWRLVKRQTVPLLQ